MGGKLGMRQASLPPAAFMLLFLASVSWGIQIWVDASVDLRADGDLVSMHALAQMADGAAAKRSPSLLFDKAAHFWSRPHKLVLTSKEALEENGIGVDASAPSLPANRVALPNVTARLKLEEAPLVNKYLSRNSFKLPEIHRLVVLPAKSREELLFEGRCRQGNLYIMGRPVPGDRDELKFDVNSAFVREGEALRLTLPLNSVLIKDGRFDTKTDSLLICNTSEEKPVLISLQWLTSSLMPRFSPEPFSMPFKPWRVDIFQSPSPDTAILYAVGDVQATSSGDDESEKAPAERAVAYVAQLDGPTKFQAAYLLYSIKQNPACSIERRKLGGPVLLDCQNWHRFSKATTLRNRFVKFKKRSRLTGHFSRSEANRSTKIHGKRKVLSILGAFATMFLARVAISVNIKALANVKEVTGGDYNDGLMHPHNRLVNVDAKGPYLSALLDSIYPGNLLRSARIMHTRIPPSDPGVDDLPLSYYKSVLITGLGMYAFIASLYYLSRMRAEAVEVESSPMLKSRIRTNKIEDTSLMKDLASMSIPVKVDTTVIYVVLP